jgi:hypothetical protein
LAIVNTVLDTFSRGDVEEIIINASHTFITGGVEGLTEFCRVPYTRALVESTFWETGKTFIRMFGILHAVEFKTRSAYDSILVELVIT